MTSHVSPLEDPDSVSCKASNNIILPQQKKDYITLYAILDLT